MDDQERMQAQIDMPRPLLARNAESNFRGLHGLPVCRTRKMIRHYERLNRGRNGLMRAATLPCQDTPAIGAARDAAAGARRRYGVPDKGRRERPRRTAPLPWRYR